MAQTCSFLGDLYSCGIETFLTCPVLVRMCVFVCVDENDILVMRNLRKEFQSGSNACVPKKDRKPPKVAVNGVCLAVQQGEVLGFLGPNGAGKTTTMNMVTGDSIPDEGEVCLIPLPCISRHAMCSWSVCSTYMHTYCTFSRLLKPNSQTEGNSAFGVLLVLTCLSCVFWFS